MDGSKLEGNKMEERRIWNKNYTRKIRNMKNETRMINRMHLIFDILFILEKENKNLYKKKQIL